MITPPIPPGTFLSRAWLLSKAVRNSHSTLTRAWHYFNPPAVAATTYRGIGGYRCPAFRNNFLFVWIFHPPRSPRHHAPWRPPPAHQNVHPLGPTRRLPAPRKPISSRSAITLRARVTAPQRADTGERTDAYAAESVFARAPRTTIDAPRRGVLLPFVAAAAAVAVITPHLNRWCTAAAAGGRHVRENAEIQVQYYVARSNTDFHLIIFHRLLRPRPLGKFVALSRSLVRECVDNGLFQRKWPAFFYVYLL